MKKTYIQPKFLQDGFLRGCTETIHVEYRERELRRGGGDAVHTAVVGKGAGGLWTCLALDGEPARSPEYKTILAAVKNAATE